MQNQQRDHIFLEFTRSICPVCSELVDAQVIVKSNKVFMKKRCLKHGEFESLISSDSKRYVDAIKYNTPGLIPEKFGTDVIDGCPMDCGLCTDHQQHSCLGIIEITNACNLQCPTCFASSEGHDFLSSNEVNFMLDKFIEQEGHPEVIQFSGGEPTIHPKILDIISLAKSKNFKYVMLNTNGIRISKEIDFVEKLSQLKPVIYLQFDGFKKETYQTIRGADLTDSKLQAIKNLEEFDIPIILVATIQRGVNEDEIGQLVDFVISKKSIRGLVFQPTFYAGRHPDFDPKNVVTLPEVIRNICTQSKSIFQNEDFLPIPCCYPTCSSACYVYANEKKIMPLARAVQMEDYIDYFQNKTIGDFEKIRDSLQSLSSFGCCIGDNATNCCTIGDMSVDLKEIEDRLKMIMIQQFMDPFNFDVKKVMKCCIHEITPQGKIIPICAFNNIPKYRQEVNDYYKNRGK